MSEKINFPSEKIGNPIEKIVDSSEPMDSDTEKIEVSTEKIPEIMQETIEKIPEKRARGQRGADKKPRNINLKSWQNLKPFRDANLSYSTSKTNWNWIVLGIVLVIAGIIVALLLYKRHKEKQEQMMLNQE